MASAERRAGVFFDRDGVLNELVLRGGHWVSPRRIEDFRLSPEVADAVPRLRSLGYALFVVTNQPDIARGLMARADLEQMTALVRAAVAPDEIVICPHDDADRCTCRKPLPGMLVALAARWDLDMERSFMVGDSAKDIGAGRQAGCRTIFIDRSGDGVVAADYTVRTLMSAVDIIERAQTLSTPISPS